MTFPGEKSALRPLPGPSAHRLLFACSARKKGNRTPSGRSGSRTESQGPRYAPCLLSNDNKPEQNMMDDKETLIEKISKGRHGSGKHPKRAEICFSEEEYDIVKEMATTAGKKSVSAFIHEFVLNEGTVKSALTPDERKTITDLSKIGTNIWKTRNSLIVLMKKKDSLETESKEEDSELQEIIDNLHVMYKDFMTIHDYFADIVKAKGQK